METTGVDPMRDSIIGIGVANVRGCFYFDLRDTGRDFKYNLKSWILNTPLVAHNAFFDAGFLQRVCGEWPGFVGCSLVLFKMLSTEGWLGQSWSLGTAIEDVLGWPESNKNVLREMCNKHGIPKSEMSRLADLEPEEFGRYCALDAEACLQLWDYLGEVCEKPEFAGVMVWLRQEFMTQIRLLVEQQLRGMHIDRHGLQVYRSALAERIDSKLKEFWDLDEVRPHVREWNRMQVEALRRQEPPQFTKGGRTTARWLKWEQKVTEAVNIQWFNPNSKQHLSWLFYNKLYDVKEVDRSGRNPQAIIEVDGREVRADLTASGRLPVHKKILPWLGRPGKTLAEYNKLVKEMGYVKACDEKSSYDGLLHLSFKVHGTITGRLGGDAGFNMQQQPKVEGYLKCLRARPGYKLIQYDISALEPVVLTNGSLDKTLMALYGPEAKPNDVYLYVMAHMPPLASKLLEFYDPNNPTPESIKRAKKELKTERSLCKLIHLSSQYGAGVGRLYHTLREAGHEIAFEEVKEMKKAWDDLFKGTHKFGNRLKKEWEVRGGWIYNLTKRPLAIDENKLHDIINTYCQSSHDVLLKLIIHIDMLRRERGVDMYPWILDFHDETIWEAPEDQAEAAANVIRSAVAAVNEELGFLLTVPFSGDVEICDTLADVKCE